MLGLKLIDVSKRGDMPNYNDFSINTSFIVTHMATTRWLA